MKHPLTADETYRYANRMFPDDGDLAAFNLIFEIRNGLLEPLDPDEIPDGEAKLVGVVGYLDLGDEYWIMQTIGEPADADALMTAMEAHIAALPLGSLGDADDAPDITRQFPTAIGAMGAWRTPDGATRYAVYRHPDVQSHHAYGVLKAVMAELEAKRHGAAANPGVDN